jgi:hypothetical protein
MRANGIPRTLGPGLALLGVLAGLLLWQHSSRSGIPVTPLGESSASGAAADASEKNALLRAAFNRDVDKVRLLLLIDPT